MTGFLASVRSLKEAAIAYRADADWIDLKEPADGALGAVALPTIEQVVKWVRQQDRQVPVSATIGDCWETPSLMPERVGRLAGAGVGYAKIGLYAASPTADLLATIRECAALGPRIIVVCFAERPPELIDIEAYAASGIAGIMLDTANKTGPGLAGLISNEGLQAFVRAAHGQELVCGLAGSLKVADIEKLSVLGADYLGFRGALCRNAVRESDFCFTAAMDVRARIDAVSANGGTGQIGNLKPRIAHY
jgi:uncharacterized protein (UPF0264 family)